MVMVMLRVVAMVAMVVLMRKPHAFEAKYFGTEIDQTPINGLAFTVIPCSATSAISAATVASMAKLYCSRACSRYAVRYV